MECPPLSEGLRREFFAVIDAALYDVPYGIIGGAALAAYGGPRETFDVDLVIGNGLPVQSVQDRLASRSKGTLTEVKQGKMNFHTTGGQIYQLDLSNACRHGLKFDQEQHTVKREGARVGTLVFLLNAKASGWKGRKEGNINTYHMKRANDAIDIEFCFNNLPKNQKIVPEQLEHVLSKDFWQPFLQSNPHMRDKFSHAGIGIKESDAIITNGEMTRSIVLSY